MTYQKDGTPWLSEVTHYRVTLAYHVQSSNCGSSKLHIAMSMDEKKLFDRIQHSFRQSLTVCI